MNKTGWSFLVGLVVGVVLGMCGWQFLTGRKLASENQRLRAIAAEAEALKADNARLSGERTDPEELKRLRDGQAELLRLRGQAAQLRREAQEAKAAAARAVAETKSRTPKPSPSSSEESPVVSFTNQVTARVGWQQTLVTGGWRLPSGKLAFVLLSPTPGSEAEAVMIGSQIVEVPEERLPELGLANLGGSAGELAGGVLTAEQAQALGVALKTTEGVNVLAAPRVSTLAGRAAQVSVTEEHALPGGQRYQTGPVISLVPTLAADRQSVELSVEAQLHLPRSAP